MSLLRIANAVLLVVGLSSPVWAQRVCTGDCSGDGAVTVDEIATGASVALGEAAFGACAAFDRDGNRAVEVDELVGAVVHALSGCPLVTVADAAFWQTLHGVRDRQEEAIELYGRALDEDPSDARSHFLLGMMHFYRFGLRLGSYDAFDDEAREEIVRANAALDLAVVHAPANRAYPGFRGAATYMNGVAHGDEALAALGLEQLRQSIELWPLFNRFSFLGTVAAVAPAGSSLFAESHGYLLDALGPDGLAECNARLCGNAGMAPRNLEGSGLLFGDIFAKAGNLVQARNWYQLSAGFGSSTWRFAELARERLATVEQRVALYQDADPENDPPLVGLGSESCAICHNR